MVEKGDKNSDNKKSRNARDNKKKHKSSGELYLKRKIPEIESAPKIMFLRLFALKMVMNK